MARQPTDELYAAFGRRQHCRRYRGDVHLLSLLVAMFTTSGVHQALHRGQIKATDGSPRAGRLLSHLPRQAWSLGLLLGLGIACVLTPLTFGLFHALGFSGLPFVGFALFKAIYTGPLGFVVTRWVILRQLLG